jgi:nucleotide-binding universal stress UspA family protein
MLASWDGSGHGLAALEGAVGLLRTRSVEHIDIVHIEWPPRPTAMWADIHRRQFAVDDLHRAAAEISTESVRRLETVLAPISSSISSSIRDGPYDDIIIELMRETRADLLLLVLGSYDPRGVIQSTLRSLLAKSTIPTWIVRAPGASGT